MPENWADLAKDYVLYEQSRGGDVQLMLERSETNSRTNEKLARFRRALTAITANWRGNYKGMWSDVLVQLEESYLVMEAYSRKQAIELASAVARASAPMATPEDTKKRGGILGLFRR